MNKSKIISKIYEMQLELNKFIGVDTLGDPNKDSFLFQFAYQLNDEFFELYEAIEEKNIPKSKVEIIDALHFLISICHILDIRNEEICDLINFKIYNNKYIDIIDIKNHTFNLIKLSHQLQNCCLTKWWVKEYKEDKNELFKTILFKSKAVTITKSIIEELFDLLVNNLHCDLDEVYRIYKMKYEKNILRQKNNYSVIGKTEDDNIEIENQLK